MSAFSKNLTHFLDLLKTDVDVSADPNGNTGAGWQQCELKSIAAKTFIRPLFYTIFGRAPGGVEDISTFNPDSFYANLEIFYPIFNYLWLGVPLKLFPKERDALMVLANQPKCQDMLKREDVSDYIKFSIPFMQEQEHSEGDVAAHNLVILHVNMNTFKATYWSVYYLLTQHYARSALLHELRQAMDNNKEVGEDGVETVAFTTEQFDKLPLLGKWLFFFFLFCFIECL
jgi:hypothetical protein